MLMGPTFSYFLFLSSVLFLLFLPLQRRQGTKQIKAELCSCAGPSLTSVPPCLNRCLSWLQDPPPPPDHSLSSDVAPATGSFRSCGGVQFNLFLHALRSRLWTVVAGVPTLRVISINSIALYMRCVRDAVISTAVTANIGVTAAVPHGSLPPWPTTVGCRGPRSSQRTVGAPLASWAMAVALQTAVAHGGWSTNLLNFQTVV
jgi:hypothetical protein